MRLPGYLAKDKQIVDVAAHCTVDSAAAQQQTPINRMRIQTQPRDN